MLIMDTQETQVKVSQTSQFSKFVSWGGLVTIKIRVLNPDVFI